MCLTAETFGMMLSLISLAFVSVDEGQVTIHTPDRDIYWVAAGTNWCAAQPGAEHLAALPLPAPAPRG